MNLREIITFHEDTIEFFVRSYLEPYITSTDSGGYYTVHTKQFYSISNDVVTINTGEYDIDITAIANFSNDTLILMFVLDQQNPYSLQYGTGTMVRKYLPYDGVMPPADWPEIF